MAKLIARDMNGRFAKSTERYTFKTDSHGNRKYFDRGKRIPAGEWKFVKAGIRSIEAEDRETRKRIEQERKVEHKEAFPVQAAADPGHVTSRGHYQFYAEGTETARMDERGTVSFIDRIEGAIDPGAHGAAEGDHVKDMGIARVESVVSIDDAANQLLDMFLDGTGSVENIYIDAIYWDGEMYSIEWYYDFSSFYEDD